MSCSVLSSAGPRSLRWALAAALVATPLVAAPSTYDLQLVVSGLDRPTDIVHAGDERLFVSEQPGKIRIITGSGQLLSTPFLDIRDRVLFTGQQAGEQGLLSLAFHPDYANNRYFFVSYVDNDGDSVIARFRSSATDPNRTSPGTERIVLRVPQPFHNHNVAQVRFGSDGYLYISTGDGGYLPEPRCTPQEIDNLLGKILRIDVDQNLNTAPYHGIPVTNPFVGPGNPRDEIWALGLRNPWRLSFDRETGDLYVADPGQDDREEVNVEPAGAPGGRNYGWKMMEGSLCRGSSANCAAPLLPCDHPAYTPPAFDYGHTDTRCAVIGGYVYRGGAIPDLVGTYVFGDFCGQLWAARRPGGSWQLQPMSPLTAGVVAFGEDAAGELHLVVEGSVYALVGADLREPEPGTVAVAEASVIVQEGGGTAAVSVTRTGGMDGAVSVGYTTTAGTATAGADYTPVNGTLSWGDGEGDARTITIAILQDTLEEGTETLTVSLGAPSGGVTVGTPATATVSIQDDDLIIGPCVADAQTLCLNDGRFQVTVDWRTANDQGRAEAVSITGDAGWFWFFQFSNPELFVKVLDACAVWDHYWVFAGGLTDVETTLRVIDTETGVIKVYTKPSGQAFEPIRDIRAFATCP